MGRKFAVIGGDLRQSEMAKAISADGNSVIVCGIDNITLENGVKFEKSYINAISNSDIIVLPLPVSCDGLTLNTPFCKDKISLYNIFKEAKNEKLVLGGKFTDRIYNIAKIHDVFCVDYFEREELAVKNAVPTAEGALQIAFEEMPITLSGSEVLVLGYGRIGKILSKMLSGIGAKVTVGARKYPDIASIESFGYGSIFIAKLSENIKNFELIFNTAPAMILDYDLLSMINKDTLIIDLASSPGGVNFDVAKNLGIKAILAQSLPGKVAPKSAGIIIKETIYNIINDLGVN